MYSLIQNGLLHATEALFAAIPQPVPALQTRRSMQVISHRGEHDNRKVFENTRAAFDLAVDAGVFGIEFDIRWTRDLQPVVIHDASLQRVFGQPQHIAELTLAELRGVQPDVPTLSDMIKWYGQRCHLMIELKAEDHPDPAAQQARLLQVLQPLQPGIDYHILALHTAIFEQVQALPTHCWLPVATTNITAMSAFALAHDCAGFAGHYALIRESTIRRHASAGQATGVGFPAHRNIVFREARRGVRWIFSNHAVRLQACVDQPQPAG